MYNLLYHNNLVPLFSYLNDIAIKMVNPYSVEYIPSGIGNDRLFAVNPLTV